MSGTQQELETDVPRRRPLTREETKERRLVIRDKAFRGELRLPGAIREMREALGLTQAEFATHFGLTRLQVIDLEKGRGNPQAETLLRICRPFGFTLGFVPAERALEGAEDLPNR